MKRFIIHEADVLDSLRTMPDASFDALQSDVPYGLGPKQPTGAEIISYLQGEELDTRGDFMGKRWSVPSVSVWREIYRVLKPGAPLLVNAAPRTFDLVALGMRAAGFEIADVIMWMFAEAMPKSYNISLGIDKAAGAQREIVGSRILTGNAALTTKQKGGTYGVGVGTAPAKEIPVTAPSTDLAKRWDGYGTALAPGYEPIILAWKPNDGTYVENVTKHGCGALNIDGCRVPGVRDGHWSGEDGSDATSRPGYDGGFTTGGVRAQQGRWPKNLVMDPGAGAMLDAAVGDRPGMSGGGVHREGYAGGMFGAIDSASTARGDNGGPSRFYYCAKASRAERELGCDDLPLAAWSKGPNGGDHKEGQNRNPHPSVKPIALTRYGATLIMPPARETPRRLLVTYAGSGSEMIGALLAGWDEVVGIEREPSYVAIARARVGLASTNPRAFVALLDGTLERAEEANPRQLSLLGDR